VIDDRFEVTRIERLVDDGWASRYTAMSLLVISLVYFAWSVTSVLISPFALARLRRRSGLAAESWASGDEL
jgi:hypothetical protein